MANLRFPSIDRTCPAAVPLSAARSLSSAPRLGLHYHRSQHRQASQPAHEHTHGPSQVAAASKCRRFRCRQSLLHQHWRRPSRPAVSSASPRTALRALSVRHHAGYQCTTILLHHSLKKSAAVPGRLLPLVLHARHWGEPPVPNHTAEMRHLPGPAGGIAVTMVGHPFGEPCCWPASASCGLHVPHVGR